VISIAEQRYRLVSGEVRPQPSDTNHTPQLADVAGHDCSGNCFSTEILKSWLPAQVVYPGDAVTIPVNVTGSRIAVPAAIRYQLDPQTFLKQME
jgi:hypothetical protein